MRLYDVCKLLYCLFLSLILFSLKSVVVQLPSLMGTELDLRSLVLFKIAFFNHITSMF